VEEKSRIENFLMPTPFLNDYIHENNNNNNNNNNLKKKKRKKKKKW
jgi:hypothetical protein